MRHHSSLYLQNLGTLIYEGINQQLECILELKQMPVLGSLSGLQEAFPQCWELDSGPCICLSSPAILFKFLEKFKKM